MVDISWGYNGDVVVFFNQQCDIWECKLTVDISWGSSWIINGSLEYWWGNHAKRGSINPWALDHWWRCHGFIHEIITSLFGWLSPPGVDNLYPVGFVPWGIPSYIPIVYGPMKNMTYFHDISSWVTWASLLFPILPRCLGITKSWTNCDYQRWFPRPSHFMWKLISLSLSSRYHVIGLNVMRPRFFITFKPPVGEPHAPGCRAVGHQALNHSALLQELFSDLQTWEVFTIAEDGDKKNITGRSSGKKFRHRKISLDTWVSPVESQELQVAATAVKVVATEPWEVFQSICTDRVWQWYRQKIYMLFKLLCSNSHENSKVNSY